MSMTKRALAVLGVLALAYAGSLGLRQVSDPPPDPTVTPAPTRTTEAPAPRVERDGPGGVDRQRREDRKEERIIEQQRDARKEQGVT